MNEPHAIYQNDDGSIEAVTHAAPLLQFETVPAGVRAAVEVLLACDRRNDATGVQRAIATLDRVMTKGAK